MSGATQCRPAHRAIAVFPVPLQARDVDGGLRGGEQSAEGVPDEWGHDPGGELHQGVEPCRDGLQEPVLIGGGLRRMNQPDRPRQLDGVEGSQPVGGDRAAGVDVPPPAVFLQPTGGHVLPAHPPRPGQLHHLRSLQRVVLGLAPAVVQQPRPGQGVRPGAVIDPLGGQQHLGRFPDPLTVLVRRTSPPGSRATRRSPSRTAPRTGSLVSGSPSSSTSSSSTDTSQCQTTS